LIVPIWLGSFSTNNKGKTKCWKL